MPSSFYSYRFRDDSTLKRSVLNLSESLTLMMELDAMDIFKCLFAAVSEWLLHVEDRRLHLAF